MGYNVTDHFTNFGHQVSQGKKSQDVRSRYQSKILT